MRIAIELEKNDWGQIIDGLECRADRYEQTAQYFESGHADLCIEEVSSAEEAHNLADIYRSIIDEIRQQMNA